MKVIEPSRWGFALFVLIMTLNSLNPYLNWQEYRVLTDWSGVVEMSGLIWVLGGKGKPASSFVMPE